jgi:Flp pilus assembly protein TadD
MRSGLARALLVAVVAVWLTGCNTDGNLSNLSDLKTPGNDAFASAAPAGDVDTGSLGAAASAEPGLLGGDPNDDLNVGKKYYRAANYGLAEKHFRRAVENHPRDAEAWLGLAASYDRLRRFELADRAYGQAIGIVGQTVEILNNQGYSYMLRGDYKRAREKLTTAQRQDPRNKFVANNLQLLEDSTRKGKGIE